VLGSTCSSCTVFAFLLAGLASPQALRSLRLFHRIWLLLLLLLLLPRSSSFCIAPSTINPPAIHLGI
jgi:hypothetical protein